METNNVRITAPSFSHPFLFGTTQNSREEIIITKHGKPVAKLVPFEEAPVSVLGFLSNTVLTSGDIVNSIDATWAVKA
jgi:hypothetical protein